MTLRRQGLILLLFLVPGLVYVAHEVQSLSANEALIADVVRRQLDQLLFVVNQYAWDYANELAADAEATARAPEPALRLDSLVAQQPALRGLALTDSTLRVVAAAGAPLALSDTSAARASGRLDRLASQLRAQGYRQFLPLTAADGRPVLLAPLASGGAALIALDEDLFAEKVLAPKASDVARGEFTFVVRREGEAVVAAGEALDGRAISIERPLWFLQGYTVGIAADDVLGSILRTRFYRSLGLIGLVALALALGVWLLLRGVRREAELAHMRSTFVSNVSHELRTPLALIRMFAETLEMGRLRSDEQRRSYYTIIRQETERLSRLVGRVLSFSQIEAGQKTYASAPLDLADVVRQVLDTYRYRLEQEGFEVDVRMPEEPLPARGDAEALVEAVLNLLDNAVKYSGEEHHVAVRAGRVGEAVYVEVEDHGIGIAAAEQRHIFDQFYRASDGLVHDVKGTGLGLALVKHIAEAHGGSVRVWSRPGEGSRFRLTLPMRTEAVPVAAGGVVGR